MRQLSERQNPADTADVIYFAKADESGMHMPDKVARLWHSIHLKIHPSHLAKLSFHLVRAKIT
jgi:hypothetical protein